jgi:hypothetical protein
MGVPRLYSRHDEFQRFCWLLCPDTFAHFPCDLKRMSLDIKTEVMKEKIKKTTEQWHVMEGAMKTDRFSFQNVVFFFLFRIRTMDKVRKPSNSVCYTPSSEPYTIYFLTTHSANKKNSKFLQWKHFKFLQFIYARPTFNSFPRLCGTSHILETYIHLE